MPEQNITLKIAGKEYALKAKSPEMEQIMRLSAEEINSVLAKYDEKFPDRSLSDKLAFVTLNETMARLTAERKFSKLVQEVDEFKAQTDEYLKDK
ncbi:MAG: cell division protein ZapA [Bacteroidales bacterium]|nr:cell division protein ZapA [Bacteroidales bacterium]